MAAQYYHPNNTYERPGLEYVRIEAEEEASMEAFLRRLLHSEDGFIEDGRLFLGFPNLRGVAIAMTMAPAGIKMTMCKK